MEFSFSTIKDFDSHIDRSIKNYGGLNQDIISLSKYFIEQETKVIDIGCSTGKLLVEITKAFDEFQINRTEFVGIEIEDNFMKENVAGENRFISFLHGDIKQVVNERNVFENVSFCTSIFTLQFLSQKDRLNVIQAVYDGLNRGGAFVFSEKIYASDAKIQDMMTFIYYDFKRETFVADDILDKENSLRKIMKPINYEQICQDLKTVGFTSYDMFWKQYNFIGMIAIKN